MKKKLVSFGMVLCLMLSLISTVSLTVSAANIVDINDSSVFLKQESGQKRCTLVATLMMFRRGALLNGNMNWDSFTEATYKNNGNWWTSGGMKFNVSAEGMSASIYNGPNLVKGDYSGNKQRLISYLNGHPEGIVIYFYVSGYAHAVLLTDYDQGSGTFYCADPAGNKASGRIPLGSSLIKDYVSYSGNYNNSLSAQNNVLANINQTWHITSGVNYNTNPVTSNGGVSPVDLGADFYATITNTSTGRNVGVSGNNVQIMDSGTLSTNPRSVWHFIRVTTGTYKIINVATNTCMDADSWGTTNGTNIQSVASNDSTAQRWYIYKNGASFIISPIYCNLVMDWNSGATNVLLYTSNKTSAQLFSINKVVYVTFDANGGKIGTSKYAVVSGNAIGTLPVPEYAGKTFLGWSPSKTGSIISASTKFKSNTTLYAQWQDTVVSHNPIPTPDPIVTPTPSTTGVHFPHHATYTQGQFTDVPPEQWFTGSVADAFAFGLMKGKSATSFVPYGDVTVAEAITMAARIHSIYTTGSENFVASGPWYQVYLDYAYQNGIITKAYYNSDVNQKATRAQFAEIFANALPAEGLSPMNSVADNAIPDVKMSASYAASVYKLYRAGILAGGNAKGTFSPGTFITRAECAAIVSRMAESNNRVAFSLN